MTAPCADRAALLKCLELACRAEWAGLGMLTNYVKNDAGASRYGILTPHMVVLSGWTLNRVTYHLRAAEAAGLVLSWNARHGGTMCWWLVGLFEQLKASA